MGCPLRLLFMGCFSLSLAQYEAWHPDWLPERDDLLCLKSCRNKTQLADLVGRAVDPHDECCTCNSLPVWENNVHVTLHQLDIEFVSTLRKSLMISQYPVQHQAFYSIEMANVGLRFFPSNLCQWDSSERLGRIYRQWFSDIVQYFGLIMKINLSKNEIKDVIDLSCLRRLDTLELSHNHIVSLSNTSLRNLTHLRRLNLQYNLIKHMDPNSIASLSLLFAHFDHNQIDTIDVTNCFSLRPFCIIDYEDNNINEIANENGFKLDTERKYGPGSIITKGNDMNTFPDFRELLHLDSLAQIGTLLTFGFQIENNPLMCDCNLEPFMSLATSVIETIWPNFKTFQCNGPGKLKDTYAGTFLNKTNLSRLKCNLTQTSDCYPCSCIDQPSENTLFVNCSGAGLKEMPNSLPYSKFSHLINLDLSNNQITTLKNTSYLGKVSHLSLANNSLLQCDTDAAYMLDNITVLDLSNNEYLSELPQVLQYKINRNMVLNNLILDCDCANTWLTSSNDLQNENRTSTFQCRVPGHGIMAPEKFSKDLLDCEQGNNTLMVLSIIMLIAVVCLPFVGFSAYRFRYELLVLLTRTKQVGKYAIRPVQEYDAYLSFDDDNDDLRKWIKTALVSYLEKSGYKIFVPLRDLNCGNVRDINIIHIINQTKTFLLILSESYMTKYHNNSVDHEWKYGWHMFKTDRNKNIVMINFDQCLTSDTRNPQIRAYLRVGEVIDFSNLDRNILQQISNKLGPPNNKLLLPSQQDNNGKSKKKTPWYLFQAKTDMP